MDRLPPAAVAPPRDPPRIEVAAPRVLPVVGSDARHVTEPKGASDVPPHRRAVPGRPDDSLPPPANASRASVRPTTALLADTTAMTAPSAGSADRVHRAQGEEDPATTVVVGARPAAPTIVPPRVTRAENVPPALTTATPRGRLAARDPTTVTPPRARLAVSVRRDPTTATPRGRPAAHDRLAPTTETPTDVLAASDRLAPTTATPPSARPGVSLVTTLVTPDQADVPRATTRACGPITPRGPSGRVAHCRRARVVTPVLAPAAHRASSAPRRSRSARPMTSDARRAGEVSRARVG